MSLPEPAITGQVVCDEIMGVARLMLYTKTAEGKYREMRVGTLSLELYTRYPEISLHWNQMLKVAGEAILRAGAARAGAAVARLISIDPETGKEFK